MKGRRRSRRSRAKRSQSRRSQPRNKPRWKEEAGQIPEIGELVETFKEKKGVFQRGYRAGAADVKGMGLVDIVRVVGGDLKMSKLIYYHRHGGKDVSEAYLEGWAQAIRDAHKRVGRV